jgi:hypothetical protein
MTTIYDNNLINVVAEIAASHWSSGEVDAISLEYNKRYFKKQIPEFLNNFPLDGTEVIMGTIDSLDMFFVRGNGEVVLSAFHCFEPQIKKAQYLGMNIFR